MLPGWGGILADFTGPARALPGPQPPRVSLWSSSLRVWPAFSLSSGANP